jgi:hypothetical protein
MTADKAREIATHKPTMTFNDVLRKTHKAIKTAAEQNQRDCDLADLDFPDLSVQHQGDWNSASYTLGETGAKLKKLLKQDGYFVSFFKETGEFRVSW